MTRVWVDDWQMQCCGQPFRVGDRVDWAVNEPDEDYFQSVLGSELAATITHHEERHTDDGGTTTPIAGTVKRIQAVRCQYASRPNGPARTLFPVAGTVDIRDVAKADRWETEEAGLRFVAYLVDLDEARV